MKLFISAPPHLSRGHAIVYLLDRSSDRSTTLATDSIQCLSARKSISMSYTTMEKFALVAC